MLFVPITLVCTSALVWMDTLGTALIVEVNNDACRVMIMMKIVIIMRMIKKLRMITSIKIMTVLIIMKMTNLCCDNERFCKTFKDEK